MGELSVMLTLSLLYGNILDPKTGKDQTGHHWSYVGDNGPKHWVDQYPRCGGDRQSPVDISPGEVEYGSWLNELRFQGYEKYLGQGFSTPITIKNNGHTASMAITDDLTLRGAHLHGDYKLAEMHLHWGSNNTIGSEHSVNGRKRPAEVHFVHYAQKYGNLSEAMKMPDGLAVVGVFIELLVEENHAVEKLCNGIEGILEYGSQTNLTSIRMMDFLPRNTNRFFHYRGSLTTPPCYESVLWFVMEDTITMSTRQLDRFRYLQEKVHEHVAATGTVHSVSSRVFKSEPVYIRDNFRPLQQLYGRKIYSNFVTMGRPQLSDFELPAVKRTPINKHSISPVQNVNRMSTDDVQPNTLANGRRPRTDYIYRGLSPNTYNQVPSYSSAVSGVISNGNNLLIGSISSRDIKGALYQHLQPDFKQNSRPLNKINNGHVFSPGNNGRLHVFQNPEAASVLANDLNAGKAAPLLDYIFTQMNGLTRNSPNKRRYNVNDYPALSQPKDRIFGGLSDLLTNPNTARVLSNPFVDNNFAQSISNRGNTQSNNNKHLKGRTNKTSRMNNNFHSNNNLHSNSNLHKNNEFHKNSNLNTNRNVQANVNFHIDNIVNVKNNEQRNNNVHPSPVSRPSTFQTVSGSLDYLAPTAMYPILDYQQPSFDSFRIWPFLIGKTLQRCLKTILQKIPPEYIKIFNCFGKNCDLIEFSMYDVFLNFPYV